MKKVVQTLSPVPPEGGDCPIRPAVLPLKKSKSLFHSNIFVIFGDHLMYL